MTTSQQTIDNLADYKITSQSNAGKIVLFEDNQAGTQDWKFASPTVNGLAGVYLTIPAGEKKELYPSGPRKNFGVGELIGFVRTVAGSFTLDQEEH